MATTSKSTSDTGAFLEDLAKPLMKTGGAYAGELLKCVLLGLAIGVVLAFAIVFSLPADVRPTMRLTVLVVGIVLCIGAFPLAYGVVGHQRGILRAASGLARSHGGPLFDQTLGRFVDTMETRRPGAMAALITKPGELAQGLHGYLDEIALKPKLLKRIALSYVRRLGERLSQGGALPPGLVTQGQFNRPVFKDWALLQASDLLLPSWRGFSIVLGLQVLTLGALWWWAR
jgi:hypothetical protein